MRLFIGLLGVVGIVGAVIIVFRSGQRLKSTSRSPRVRISETSPPGTTPVPALLPIGLKQDWNDVDNPERDGWDTELLAQQADQQLHRLGQLLIDSRPCTESDVGDLITDDFTGDTLLPATLKTVF